MTKRFGAFVALKGVDFVARKGEVTALVGPNGAGKTTLFHILDGNLRPDAGRVSLYGEDVTGLAPWRMARRGVGRLFQDVRVFNDLTARENVSAALMSAGVPREEAQKWLDFAGVADKADEKARSLSSADRRLLAIARLLALRARLFLLDEPTASLPPEEKGQVYGFVRKLAEEREASVVIVEHDKAAVTRFADSACFLHEGEALCAGTTENVFADERVRALYADGEESSLRAVPGKIRLVDGSLESEKGFRAAFEKAGGQIVATESFPFLASDLRPQVAKLLEARPDGIFVTGFGQGLITAINQLREGGWKGTICTDTAVVDPRVKKNLAALSDIVFVGNAFDEERAKGGVAADFAAKYRKLTGSDSDEVPPQAPLPIPSRRRPGGL